MRNPRTTDAHGGPVTTNYLGDSSNDWEGWSTYERFSEKHSSLRETRSFTLFYGDSKHGKYSVIDSTGHTLNPFENGKTFVVSNNGVPLEGRKILPKVTRGEEMMQELLEKHPGLSQTELLEQCFMIAATTISNFEDASETDFFELAAKSIMVPPIRSADLFGSPDKVYGTRSTIVILVRDNGDVVLEERVYHDTDEDSIIGHSPKRPKQVVRFHYNIQ